MQSLNASQLRVARHPGGPALVWGPPGTGKTWTLLAYLLEQVKAERLWPYDVLVLTFSRRAAAEFRLRLSEALGDSVDVDRLAVRTLHGHCWHILSRHLAGRTDRPPRVYLPAMALSVLARAVTDVIPNGESAWSLAELWDLIAPAREAGLGPEPFQKSDSVNERFVGDVYAAYDRRMRAENAWDFPGLISGAVQLIESEPGLLAQLQAQHPAILVDEGQDTSLAQWRLVRLLAGLRRQVMIVADPAQEIYAWRGTDWASLEAHVRDAWPETATLALDENYRSAAHILRCGTALLDPERYPSVRVRAVREPGRPVEMVRLAADSDEAAFVVRRVRSWLDEGLPPREIAVLARTSRGLQPIARGLEVAGIPRDLVGRRGLLELPEARHLLAYLALAALEPGNAERHLGTVLNVPPRGIGLVAQRLISGGDARPTWAQLRRAAAGELVELRPAARAGVTQFLELVETLRLHAAQTPRQSPQDLIDLILALSGYYRWVSGLHEDAAALANLEVLREQAAAHETVRDFLESVDRRLAAQEQALPGEGVQLATLHAVKGLEYQAVIVIGCEEGLIPHHKATSDADLEAERRNLYVALTRARDHEVLTWCAERDGRRQVRSRFLGALPRDCVTESGGLTYGGP
ncbi:MAG: ATP-dependent helicase [Anaerolineales bacterium]|nr:ATP-dependent helicase [Anaerolineales bacterium]